MLYPVRHFPLSLPPTKSTDRNFVFFRCFLHRDQRKFLMRPAQFLEHCGISKFTDCLIADCHGVAHFSAINGINVCQR